MFTLSFVFIRVTKMTSPDIDFDIDYLFANLKIFDFHKVKAPHELPEDASRNEFIPVLIESKKEKRKNTETLHFRKRECR
jgi:hypothetical protein